MNKKVLTDEEYKLQSKKNWGSAPCGSTGVVSDEELNREYFEKIIEHKRTADPWVFEDLETLDVQGKKVLEIGYGMGVAHLELAKKGGVMHGIDITPENKRYIHSIDLKQCL